jgi:CBS domain-containing protein
MKVRELMSSPAHTVRATDSLADAARLLWDHDCGMLPVVDGDGRVGAAITDRDICMGALTRGKALAGLRVADSMSRRLVTCGPDDDVGTAARRMEQHQLHRLPVVDGQGKPCGVLSLNDLALAAAEQPATAPDALRVLVAACKRRATVPMTIATPGPAAPATAAPARRAPPATAGA